MMSILNFLVLFMFAQKESDKIGDLDNLIKPIIDTFSGCNGIFIDDSQIGSINSLWMSRDVSSSRNSILKLCIHFNNDDCCIKENMRFVQIENKCMLYIF